MEITVLTHQGLVVKKDVELIQIVNNERNFQILENHIPVVTVVETGYIRYNYKDKVQFVYLSGAIFEFSNNFANVLAQEAYLGNTLEEAKENFIKYHDMILEKNRKDSIDFTKKEKELHDHLRNAGAGNL